MTRCVCVCVCVFSQPRPGTRTRKATQNRALFPLTVLQRSIRVARTRKRHPRARSRARRSCRGCCARFSSRFSDSPLSVSSPPPSRCPPPHSNAAADLKRAAATQTHLGWRAHADTRRDHTSTAKQNAAVSDRRRGCAVCGHETSSNEGCPPLFVRLGKKGNKGKGGQVRERRCNPRLPTPTRCPREAGNGIRKWGASIDER